jgi:predicted GTPase
LLGAGEPVQEISELGYQDKETEYLDKMFSDLENPRHETNTVQIALVGDAGHGKSSTINSLLGVDIAEYVSAHFNTQRYQRC